jgi:bifunctional non-homologous end joining protein LigD
VETVTVFAPSYRRNQTYVMCNNLATLLWLGQINNLAVHVSLSRADHNTSGLIGSTEALKASVLYRPDFLLFDLDPYIDDPAERWTRTCEVARVLKSILDAMSVPSFVKTSGARGLHVLAPMERTLSYEATEAVCATVAASVAAANRRLVTLSPDKAARTGKVFIDSGQNGYSKSLAAPYSPRATAAATVSMPLQWAELDTAAAGNFHLRNAYERLATQGDIWQGFMDSAVDLELLLHDRGAGGT